MKTPPCILLPRSARRCRSVHKMTTADPRSRILPGLHEQSPNGGSLGLTPRPRRRWLPSPHLASHSATTQRWQHSTMVWPFHLHRTGYCHPARPASAADLPYPAGEHPLATISMKMATRFLCCLARTRRRALSDILPNRAQHFFHPSDLLDPFSRRHCDR